ncbi:hypothetical protein HanRHA438_Chr03g0113681 [Helianthus annuus]|uniref:Uncharacterized protein n=1 Tax=Helianthus annuus TaxID=4232 RepID=A0A9K3JEQ4_HELAN|nr:hypothetical protein HanXRQr2_Chr03g0102781 [Helianthus annuus]KAJ0934975.1 hypothetical protein HanRHA438_Chr03g0113681 [Helianthus annuus]
MLVKQRPESPLRSCMQTMVKYIRPANIKRKIAYKQMNNHKQRYVLTCSAYLRNLVKPWPHLIGFRST